MNKQEEIKKIKDEIKELEKRVEKLENSKEKWFPDIGEEYWYVTFTRDIDILEYRGDSADKEIIKYNKVFKTQEEAEHYRDYLNARDEASYNFSEEEWKKTDLKKYFIYYDSCYDKSFSVNMAFYYRDIGKIYFKTAEDAKDFIDKWSKEIKEYEFGITE